MAKFLTTQKAYAEIEDITRKADKELVLISPWIKISNNLLERLKDLDERNIKIILVCRGEDLKAEERNKLNQLKHLELRFLENLHAKCFYNHQAMVITSLNLHDYSQQNNREMGVLLTFQDDSDVFLEARAEAQFIVRSAEEVSSIRGQNNRLLASSTTNIHQSPEPKRKEQKKPERGLLEQLGQALGLSELKGYCIRGGEEIPLDPYHPLCDRHYEVWKEHQDPDYKEHYCHYCGKSYRTSYRKPLCPACFDKHGQ